MKTIQELKQELARKQLDIMERKFDLLPQARQVDISMSAAAKEALGPRNVTAARLAEGEAFAEREREKLRVEFEEAYLDYLEKRARRLEELEEIHFGPSKTADPDVLLRAASVTPEQLRTMMDMSLRSGNLEAAQVAFHAAYERDLDDLVFHYVEAVAGMQETWSEFLEAENERVYDADELPDLFERLTGAKLSKTDLLRQPGDPTFPHSA